MTERGRAERRLGWWLSAPALVAMALVTVYPIAYAFWLSLFRHDLRFPEQRGFVGWANYASVLSSPVWWQALTNTLLITAASVAVELVLGFAMALLMHRATVGRQTVRASILVPYAIITVVAALAWKFAFDPTTGFVNALLGLQQSWLTERWSAFLVIIATEIWKTTPFMALLLLAGLALISEDLIRAARVDGASAWQRLRHVTLPLMKPTIGVAMLFRTLDAVRIFDTVYVQTRGGQNTETLSLVAYDTLIVRLNLGLGSAVAALIFVVVALIAWGFLRSFGVSLEESR
ncbi:carbohydrate ABC transporter permease [Methylotetracoccus oryzae]|uniref:carbohydrate ABC transporter permease n=1 Tax=Methylotetracoccus oryzae TaxID=1919059 RepID=UPI0011183532|nr:sugar ABC transporter permease [Methylotetracoccus oryzae]